MAADEEGEEPERVEYEGDHEPRLWPDRPDRSTICGPDGVFGEGQVLRRRAWRPPSPTPPPEWAPPHLALTVLLTNDLFASGWGAQKQLWL